jgi:Holliday junction DNA helicase RuvB
MIAATTRIALISSPLRSRFSGGVFRLEFYEDSEIERIVERSAKILNVPIEHEGKAQIAKRSRMTPRTANYLLKRARDYAQVHKESITGKIVHEALELLGIDSMGLTEQDRKILQTIIEKFNGGPVGLNTIAASLSEEEATIEEFNEPYLLQIGFMERTPRGRIATEKAYAHLGIKYPEDKQAKLL